MFRHRNTDCSGKPFDPATIQAVWERAQISGDHAPLRKDSVGSLIWWEGYGNTNSKLGWEIDHIRAVERGGGDELDNLQAMQWENHWRKDELMKMGNGSGGGAERRVRLGTTNAPQTS